MSTTPGTAVASTDLMDGIKAKLSERLRAGFVELIPPEAFDQMTDAALDEFLHGPRRERFSFSREWLRASDPRNPTGEDGYVTLEIPRADSTYNPHRDPNTLPGMIMAEFTKAGHEHVKRLINTDPRFTTLWDGKTGQSLVPIANELILDNADALVAGLFRGIISAAMSSTFSSLRSNTNGIFPPNF